MPDAATQATSKTRAVLQLRDVFKTYVLGTEKINALNGVSLDIHGNEYVAVMGPSGSGKSTLMNIVGCLDVPTSGTYELDGEMVAKKSEAQLADIRNRMIGFVFQTFNLLARSDVFHNVELPLIYRGVPAAQRHILAGQALAAVGLEGRERHTPAELSGGQQQRVAIARALANRPALLLADEPTGNLDPETASDVMGFFEDCNAEGRTIVMVTHDPELARRAHRNVHVLDGQVTDFTEFDSALRMREERIAAMGA